MTTEKFKSDLKNGKAGEQIVANRLKEFYKAKEIDNRDKGKLYDFILIYEDGSRKLFEVKTDFAAAKTGNLFFEYSCNSKQSGLLTTTADKYAFLVPHLKEILVFSPSSMYEKLINGRYRNITTAGDGGRVCGFIAPIEDIRATKFVEIISL